MIRRIALILLVICMIISIAGCWDSRDLTETAIATAFGIDELEDGKAMVSVQIVKPSSAMEVGKAGGGGNEKGFVVVSNTADTVLGALREMLSKVNNEISYSSSQVIVIGEEAAKQGIGDYIDFVLRDHETQFKQYVIVTKGVTAKDILEQEYDLSNVPGAYIRDTIENIKSRAFSKQMMLIEVARELATEGRELCIGTIEKEGKTTDTRGIAVFLKDRMIGWLNAFESRGYMFLMGRVGGTIVEVDNPEVPGKQVTVQVKKVSSKEKLEWDKDGKPVFTVKIEVQGSIGEQYGGHGTMDRGEFFRGVTQYCNEKIKGEVFQAVTKCQKEYKSDILGIGMMVFDEKPRYWRAIKESWNSEIFPETKVRIDVETKLLQTGLLNRPIDVD